MRPNKLVPILQTERLRLRSFTAADFDVWAEVLNDAEVLRHLGPPHPREDVWRRVSGSIGLWTLLGYGYWAVERLEDCRLIGQVGFADFKRDMTPSIVGLPEMGWIFASDVHGKGYAFEAAAAAMAWADEALKGQEFTAIIDPDNGPSIKLAERLGFGEREEARYKDEPILLFRRARQA